MSRGEPYEEREELRALTRRLERLPEEAWDPPAPPPLRAPPGPTARDRGRRRPAVLLPRPALAALAAVALLAAGVGLGRLTAGDGDSPSAPRLADRGPTRTVALRALGPGSARAAGRVVLAPGPPGRASVRVSGLASLDRGFYELWLLDARGGLVSLGGFRVGADGNARLDVPLPADPARFTFLDVSAEPADGDPTHSSKSVLRGRLPA